MTSTENTPTSPRRIRVLGYIVQPQVLIDDGEHLTPYPVQPLNVPAAEWSDWVAAGLPQALEELERQALE